MGLRHAFVIYIAGGHCTCALIDTGVNISYVTHSIWKKLQGTTALSQQGVLKAKVANSGSIGVLGTSNVRVSLAGVECIISMQVVDHLSLGFIIGLQELHE